MTGSTEQCYSHIALLPLHTFSKSRWFSDKSVKVTINLPLEKKNGTNFSIITRNRRLVANNQLKPTVREEGDGGGGRRRHDDDDEQIVAD